MSAAEHVSCWVQKSTSVHSRQTLAGPLSSSQKPVAHAEQRDVESLLQVRSPTQWSTTVQSLQVLAGPLSSSQVPLAHCVHRDVSSLPHVNGDSQCTTGAHRVHASPGPGPSCRLVAVVASRALRVVRGRAGDLVGVRAMRDRRALRARIGRPFLEEASIRARRTIRIGGPRAGDDEGSAELDRRTRPALVRVQIVAVETRLACRAAALRAEGDLARIDDASLRERDQNAQEQRTDESQHAAFLARRTVLLSTEFRIARSSGGRFHVGR